MYILLPDIYGKNAFDTALNTGNEKIIRIIVNTKIDETSDDTLIFRSIMSNDLTPTKTLLKYRCKRL